MSPHSESSFRAYKRPPILKGRQNFRLFAEQIIPESLRSAMSVDAKYICNNLLTWRNAADRWMRWTSVDPVDDQFFIYTSDIKGSQLHGNKIPIIEVVADRRSLARLISEARRRARLDDWDWFYWLHIFGDFRVNEFSDFIEDRYSGMIAGRQVQRNALRKLKWTIEQKKVVIDKFTEIRKICKTTSEAWDKTAESLPNMKSPKDGLPLTGQKVRHIVAGMK